MSNEFENLASDKKYAINVFSRLVDPKQPLQPPKCVAKRFGWTEILGFGTFGSENSAW